MYFDVFTDVGKKMKQEDVMESNSSSVCMW